MAPVHSPEPYPRHRYTFSPRLGTIQSSSERLTCELRASTPFASPSLTKFVYAIGQGIITQKGRAPDDRLMRDLQITTGNANYIDVSISLRSRRPLAIP